MIYRVRRAMLCSGACRFGITEARLSLRITLREGFVAQSDAITSFS